MTQVMLFFTQVNFSDILQFFAGVWFLKQNLKIFTFFKFYPQLLCPLDGTLNGAPCQG